MMNLRHLQREIDLEAFAANVRLVKSLLPARTMLMAVVKADAYGHGAVPCARTALDAGASWLAVATVEEALELREHHIEAPVLVLGAAVGGDAADAAVAHDITLAVCTADMVHTLTEAAARLGRRARVHLKTDTGMSRIGVRTEEERDAVVDAVSASGGLVELTGVFTHFADADGDDLGFAREQLERFRRLSDPLPKHVLRHCANSAAIECMMPEAAFEMARAGISLYGYSPTGTCKGLKMCMRWTAEITYVKTVHAGDTVSYGRTFRADHDMKVATVSCGYGDGYHRLSGGEAWVLVHGCRCRVLGRICMDQMMVDVSGAPRTEIGDTAVLMGTDGSECIDADMMAGWAHTIPYEILLAATNRVPRVYKD